MLQKENLVLCNLILLIIAKKSFDEEIYGLVKIEPMTDKKLKNLVVESYGGLPQETEI
jgi:hypothetical protein